MQKDVDKEECEMDIRFTPEAKEYLERIFKSEKQWLHLTMLQTGVNGKMSYAISWTKTFDPTYQIGSNHCDAIVVVVDHKYRSLFKNILIGLDSENKVIILENPNVILQENNDVLVANG